MEESVIVMDTILDRTETYTDNDPQGMIEVIESFSQHCREAYDLTGTVDLSAIEIERVRNLFVLGMGGSGVSGDILRALYQNRLSLNISTVKDYDPPASLNSGSLAIAVSYSGNTEETISAVEQAVSRKAQIIAVTSGGKLRDIAEENGLPCVIIPPGLQPRAALGYLAIPLMVLIEKLWPQIGETDFNGLFELVESVGERFNHHVATGENLAKQIAQRLRDRMPVIYGCEGASGVAAMRWKTQINENSKSPAYHQIFSELDHNEIVGWHNLSEIGKATAVVVLHDDNIHSQNNKRIEITKDLIAENVGDIIDVNAQGRVGAQQLFSLIYLGDFVSAYLAFLYKTDPTPVDRIESLKKMLAD